MGRSLAALVEETADVDVLLLFVAGHVEGDGFGDVLLRSEHGQIVALAIGEVTAYGAHFADEHRIAVIDVDAEGDRSGLFHIYREGLGGRIDFLFGLSIEQTQACYAFQRLVSLVDDARGNGGLVSLTYESWQVGLYHEILAAHGSGEDLTVVDVLVVGKTEELPFGEALGQGEADADVALGIGKEVGIEEGCLGKVAAKLQSRRGASGFALLCYYFFLHAGCIIRGIRFPHHDHVISSEFHRHCFFRDHLVIHFHRRRLGHRHHRSARSSAQGTTHEDTSLTPALMNVFSKLIVTATAD